MVTEKQSELEFLLEQANKAFWDDVDFEAAYKLFKKALKLAPTDPCVNINFAISACYAADANYYELSQQLFTHIKNAAENGLMALSNDTISDLICGIVVYCVQTNQTLHEECKSKKAPLSHNELVTNIRAIEMHTGILEYVAALIEHKEQGTLDFKSYYLDCLKEISLRISFMFGKYDCRDCNGLCKSSEWDYFGDLNEKFEITNEKILKLDSKYKIPHKAKPTSDFSVFMRKLNRDKHKYCQKCNKKLTTDDLKNTDVLGVTTTERSVDATVYLTFICKECGELSTHTLKRVTLKWIDSNGWIREYSVDDEVKRYLER